MEYTKMTTRLFCVFAAVALAVGLNPSISSAQPAALRHIDVPEVPGDLVVEEGNVAFLEGRAVGTQNYICLPVAGSFKWTFTGPQATLFLAPRGELQQQITTHFLSANPEEGNLPRPTWQHSLDSSRVWGRVKAISTDANYVEAGAIPWLLLEAAGTAEGTSGGSLLTRVTFIHRVNTSGGVAPSTGCAQASNVGVVALVPYSTDYIFYRAIGPRQDRY
jgi:hypothetical protein